LPPAGSVVRAMTRGETTRRTLSDGGLKLRLGFSLEDIREYLSHYRPDTPNVEQYRDGIEKIRRRLAALEQMRVEIDEAIGELKDMEKDALRRLSDCEAREAAGRAK
jgi:DNA-binding transcriptional MerR regulator